MLNLKQSRIFRTGEGAPTPEDGQKLLFGKIFAENGMKMKEIGPRAVADLRGAPGTSAPGVQILSFSCSFRQKKLAHPR